MAIFEFPRKVMPACFYPTSIVVVDDNKKFLKHITMLLSDSVFSVFFNEPLKALNFLNNEYQPTPFISRCLKKEASGKYSLLFNEIVNEIYNPNRFDELGSVVVDYAMPGKNGIEFCRELNKPIKTIMLTGEATYDVAEKASQDGELDQFVRKDLENLEDVLMKYIYENQFSTFQAYSFSIVPLLLPEREELHCLFDPKLIDFLKSLFKAKNAVEYYLIDRYGSYLLLNKDGKPMWFFLRSEDDIKDSIELAKKLNAPQEILSAIEKGEKLLTLHKDSPQLNKVDWNTNLYPTSQFIGNKKYYYAFVEKLNGPAVIDPKKILSFKDFLLTAESLSLE